jgi:membrane-associated phospholipid phosphatase
MRGRRNNTRRATAKSREQADGAREGARHALRPDLAGADATAEPPRLEPLGITSVRLPRPGLLALVSGVLFVAITLLYRAGAVRGFDQEVASRLVEIRTGWLDFLGTADDLLFRPTPTFVAALVLTVLLWRFGPPWSWCAPPAIVVSGLAEVVVKNGWSQILHPRALLEDIQVLFGVHLHAPSSFPSGHVTRASFLAIIVFAFLPRKISIPFGLLALTCGFARMYTEAHKLSDVAAGAALGTAVASTAVWAVTMLIAMEGDRPGGWRAVGTTLARRLLARRAA